MPFLVAVYILFWGVAALLAQMVLPLAFPILNVVGFGSALIPLIVIYASLEVGDETIPVVAGLLGLLLDLVTGHRLGLSVLILTSISALIVTQAQKPESHNWVVRLTFVLVGTFLFMLLNYLMILVETARWAWPLDVWSKIAFASILNVILCPFVFLLVGLPLRLLGWRPAHEKNQRHYAR